MYPYGSSVEGRAGEASIRPLLYQELFTASRFDHSAQDTEGGVLGRGR